MPKTIHFNYFEEFINHNRDFVNGNPITNVFLIRNFGIAYSNPQIIIDFFNIEEQDERIVVLFIQNICLIYGNLTTKVSIELLSKELYFEKFKNYTFAGNRNIIHQLLDFNKSDYEEIKYLCTYKCIDTNEISIDGNTITKAKIENFEEVKNIHTEFSNEFYAGFHNVPEISDENLKNDLNSGHFFVIKNETEIMSIACYRKEFEFPELNFVFTKNEYRGHGYAKNLTYYITNYLLENKNEFVMLYTKGDNLNARKCFEDVGYKLTDEYTMTFKKHNV